MKRMDFDVIGMVKKSPKMFFRYDGEDMSLISIYNKNKKRRGKSKYLLSVMVDVVKDGDIRESNDNRSLGELFLYFSDEMSDITWIQAFQMLLQMFRTMLSDNTELSDEKINELANAFMDALPTMMKIRLQAA